MNLGYRNRRIASMTYKLRIVSLAWASTNLFEKPRKGWRLYLINGKPFCSEVKILRRGQRKSPSVPCFSSRMRVVPYASKPSQTRINLAFSERRKKKPTQFNANAVRLVRRGARWRKRLARPAAYFERFDLRYLNSVRTTSRSLRSRNKYKNTSYISKKM